MTQSAPHTSTQPPQPRPPQLVRAPRQKVVAGVCGGLGRYCDLDPVIFRIVIVVLTLTGGIGLIFYGFAWLLVPLDGEDDNELRRLLSGRVDGASLIAVLLALVGCGLFLSMLNNGETLGFATLLSIATIGAAVWSQRRYTTAQEGGPLDPGTAAAVAEAPRRRRRRRRRAVRRGGATRSSRTVRRVTRHRPGICGVRTTRPTTRGVAPSAGARAGGSRPGTPAGGRDRAGSAGGSSCWRCSPAASR